MAFSKTKQPASDHRCRGSNHPRAKLSERDVANIRKSHDNGETITSLKKRHNVNRKTIEKIVWGLSWTHVEVVK